MGFIYSIANKYTGMVYIGQTTRKNVSHRWREHVAELRHGRHANYFLLRDWNICGEDGFVFSVVEEINNKNLDARELYGNELCSPASYRVSRTP